MAITAENNYTPRELTPAGSYIARCYSMIEIGTIETEYKGEKKWLHKVRIGWEFPLETKVFNEEKGEQPIVISKEYTLSMADKANLRADLANWRGKAFSEEEAKRFDITKLVGVPCMINVIHEPGKQDPSKIYEKVGSIMPLPKGTVCPPQINPTFILSYDDWDDAKFEALPDFIKDKIKLSKQFKNLHINDSILTKDAPINNEPDDLPF
jgi:hypothetical protein